MAVSRLSAEKRHRTLLVFHLFCLLTLSKVSLSNYLLHTYVHKRCRMKSGAKVLFALYKCVYVCLCEAGDVLLLIPFYYVLYILCMKSAVHIMSD